MSTADHRAHVSATVASRLIVLREQSRLTREALAEAARAAGAPGGFTVSALRNIESGRPDEHGQRRRDVTVDELVFLAAALEVSPADLLDEEYAPLFGAPPRAPEVRRCARCDARAAGIQSAVRDDVEALGDLVGVEPSLAALAYDLAEAIDDGGGEDGRLRPALAKELRATLKELADGRRDDGGGDELDGLEDPD